MLTHARALLTSVTGETAYLDADARDPAAILSGAAATLDFSQPVAVMLIAVALPEWRPDVPADPGGPVTAMWGGVGRKA